MSTDPGPDDGTVVPRFLWFVGLTYAVTWLLLVPIVLEWVTAAAPIATALYLVGAFGPTVGALALTYRHGGRPAVRSLLHRLTVWRVGVRWYALVVLPVLVKGLSAVALVWLFGVTLEFSHLAGNPLPLTVVVVLIVAFIPGPIGEELGWRGYAVSLLQRRFGPLAASLLVGVVWAGWHIPTFYVPFVAQAEVPFGWFALEVVAISVVFTWLYNNTRGSVLLAILLHAGNNAVTPVLYPAVEAAGASGTFAMLNAVGMAVVAVGIVLVVGREGLLGPADTSVDRSAV